ncbi:cache domain-containing protein [Desulfobacter sp.]|uniref:cache domain-containing protein n=1 Tax=Desulfobacter sp. TaxID=2294 RepID=UPI003D0F6ACB
MHKKKLEPDKTASQEIDITHEPIAKRKELYQVLTRNVRIRILLVSIIPMMLISGMLCRQCHLTYSDKISAPICELVLKHIQNIDAFLTENLGNVRYLARLLPYQSECCVPQHPCNIRYLAPLLPTTDLQMAQQFLTSQLSEHKNEYGDVFTDPGLVDSDGIQFAYEGPFRLINADYSEASCFLKAKENPYSISDVFAGIRGHPHFIIAVKLSAQGRTYILKSSINFTAFNSLVGNAQIGRTGTAFIVNAKGELQTHPRSGTTGAIPSFIADPTIFKHDHTLNNGHGPSLVFIPRHGPQQTMKLKTSTCRAKMGAPGASPSCFLFLVSSFI